MEKKFRLYLEGISYGGDNIGSNLTVTITPGSYPPKDIKPKFYGKPLKAGQSASKMGIVLLTDKTVGGSKKISLQVKIVEKDKISDEGTATKEIIIDMKTSAIQKYEMEITVDGKGGDKGKTAKFALKFAGEVVTEDLTVDGVSKVAVAGSRFEFKPGEYRDTTAKELKREGDHVKKYDGKTEFQAFYFIEMKGQKVDTKKSKVVFKTVNYTSSGILVPTKFTTQPITITDVKLVDSKVESFKFESKDWYSTDPGDYPDMLTNNGLSGSINLKTGDSSYVASYILKKTGVVCTYTVTGKIKVPAP